MLCRIVLCDACVVLCVGLQRLSGAGYCFSASSPPFCSAAALASFSLIDRNATQLIPALHARTQRMHHALRSQLTEFGLTLNGQPITATAAAATAGAGAAGGEVKFNPNANAKVSYDVYSPIIHLRLARPIDPARQIDRRLFIAVSQAVPNTPNPSPLFVTFLSFLSSHLLSCIFLLCCFPSFCCGVM